MYHYRHVHIYLQIGYELRSDIATMLPPVPASYTGKKAEEWQQRWLTDTATRLVHTRHISRVVALLFDFESPEPDTLYACPEPRVAAKLFDIDRMAQKEEPAALFMFRLGEQITKRGLVGLSPDRVSYRSSWDGDKYAIRAGLLSARNGEVLRTVPTELLLKLNWYTRKTIIGPEDKVDQDVMIDRCGLRVVNPDLLMGELLTTLAVYQRAGLAVGVNIG